MGGGTLRWHGSNTQDISAAIDMVNGKTATFDTNGNDVVFATGLGDGTSASLVKTGTGSLTLTGGGTYTGGTSIRAGTIIANNANCLGSSGSVTLNDTNTGNSNTSLLLGNVALGRAVTIANLGSGATTLGANGSVPNPEFAGEITLARDVILDGGTNMDRLTFTGGIVGTGNITVSGAGRVMFLTDLNPAPGDERPFTFNGNLIVNSGSTFQLHWGGPGTSISYIPDTSIVTVNGTLKLAKGNNSETIGGLSGGGVVLGHDAVANVASALIIDSSGSHTFGGTLSDGGAAGSTLSLTKTGSGTQSLAGINTYTGNTVVNGGTLHLLDNAALTFRVTNSSGNSLTGSGTVALDGNFAIDIAAVTAAGTWQLENATSLPGAYGGTFQVVTPAGTPWTDNGDDTWTTSAGGLKFTFAETTGTLTAVQGGFASWIAGFGLDQADQDPADDPDQDGVNNLVEYAIAGRNPAVAEGAAGAFTSGTLSFTKRPEAAADPAITYQIRESDDLGISDPWTEAPAGPEYVNTSTIISYTLPAGKAKTFARLVVVQLP
jgi:autotransporter-associated beta strand protein